MGQKLRSHATIMVPIPRGESPILFYPLEVDLGSLFLSIFVPKQWALVLLLSRDGICSLWWEISKQKDAISYFNLPKETESRDREKGQNLADLGRSDVTPPFLRDARFFCRKWGQIGCQIFRNRYENVWCDEALFTFWQRLRNCFTREASDQEEFGTQAPK